MIICDRVWIYCDRICPVGVQDLSGLLFADWQIQEVEADF